jgi:hypothetical protein
MLTGPRVAMKPKKSAQRRRLRIEPLPESCMVEQPATCAGILSLDFRKVILLIFHIDGFQPSVDCLSSLQIFIVHLGAGLFVLHGARIVESAELQDCAPMYYKIQARRHVCNMFEESRLVPCPRCCEEVFPDCILSK